LETLELLIVLDRVAEHAAGPLGRLAVQSRRPSTDVGWIQRELAMVAEVAAMIVRGDSVSAEAAPEVSDALGRVRVEGSVLSGSEIRTLRALLLAARATLATLRRIKPDAPRVAALIRTLPHADLDRALDRAIDDRGELLDGASTALSHARRAVRSARSRLLQKLEKMLQALERDASDRGTVTLRGGRYVISVRRDTRQRPVGIVHDESASQETLFIEPSETIELGNALREAEVAEERETLRVLRDLTKLLRSEVDQLEHGLAMAVAFDDLVARAKYAASVGAMRPEVAPAPTRLEIVGARHPLLLGGESEIVPFSLSLDPDERTVVISGPNAGGKTVVLKAVGLLAAMAQAGIIPPTGPGSRLPVFRRFFVDIGDHQSIAANLSTFSAHVRVLRDTLEHADATSLVLIDEIGSGTDPAEGGALAEAALGALTRAGATTLASTHLGALKRLSETHAGVVNASLQFDPETLSPTYRLKKGVPGRSYGLAIARRLGVPEAVLQEADACLPAGERAVDALLAELESRQEMLRVAEAEATARHTEIVKQEERLAEQATQHEVREAELDRRLRESEHEGRSQARAYLLEARRRVEDALAMARAAVDEATAREARRLVEEGVRQESQAQADPGSTPNQSRPIVDPVVAGMRVRLANGTVGDVLERRSDGRVELRVGVMRMVVDPREVVDVAARPTVVARGATLPPGLPTADPAGTASLEVDLRGMTGDEAEVATIAAIDRAVLLEQPYLRIIHGKGTGVVRDRVLRVVSHDGRVARYEFAKREAGGTGVTMVEFAT
jgi:DNA mismatch repair protein MutS2